MEKGIKEYCMKEAEKHQVNDFFVCCPKCDEYIETHDNYKDEEVECPECGEKFLALECNEKSF
jgi:DNA-directed RNA polymerase subunit RPC12/RpoP